MNWISFCIFGIRQLVIAVLQLGAIFKPLLLTRKSQTFQYFLMEFVHVNFDHQFVSL
jgi:hypothetical protein